jgi:hypothetical protein
MRRNRFLEICRFLHCADNTKPDSQDKIWELRPLMDRVKNNCLKCFVPEENLCYNDCMVKYFERHRCKQYIRGKPIRFGYKIWSLNAPSAYLVNFQKYQGNNPRRSLEYEKNFGKSAAPLVAMLEELKEAKGFHPHISLDYSDRNASVSRTVPFPAIATSPQKCVASYSDP